MSKFKLTEEDSEALGRALERVPLPKKIRERAATSGKCLLVFAYYHPDGFYSKTMRVTDTETIDMMNAAIDSPNTSEPK